MLWETLKKKVAVIALLAPDHDGIRALQQRAKDWGYPQFIDFLNTIDVRQADILRDIVPEAFPRKLRKGRLVASQNIHGAWRVDVEKNPDSMTFTEKYAQYLAQM